MAAPTNIPKEQVQNLLSDAITVLCKNTLLFHTELCVEGLLGITLDKKDVVLINIKEIIDRSNLGRDVNATCRECRGLGKIMLHSDLPAGNSQSQSQSTANYANPTHWQMTNSSAVQTVASPPAPPQRQIFHTILPRQPNAAQRTEPQQKFRGTTIVVPQGQQPVQQQPQSSDDLQSLQLQPQHSAPPTPTTADMEISGHCSEDEVAATIIKKPRVYRNPRKVIPVDSSASIVTSGSSYTTQTVPARATVSPHQKQIRVKMEPQKETSSGNQLAEPDQEVGFASVFNSNSTVELAPMLGIEGATIKRTLSFETSQSPKLQPTSGTLQMQVPAPPASTPAVVFNPDEDDNLSDINNSTMPTSEDFYAFFTGKLDLPASMGGKPAIPMESGEAAIQEIPTLHEIEPGEIVFSTQATGQGLSKADDDVTSPYLGSIEISPKSSLEADIEENADKSAVVMDEVVIPAGEQDANSFVASEVAAEKHMPGPRKLLPEDVVSAQIVLLDRQPVFSPSGQPLPTAHSTLTEGSTLLAEGVHPTRKAPGGKFGPKIAPNTVVVKKADTSKKATGPGVESVKVFLCPYCNKVFTHRASLVRHKRIHKGKFCACFLCGKNFHRRDVLNRHVNTMHKGDTLRDWLNVNIGEQMEHEQSNDEQSTQSVQQSEQSTSQNETIEQQNVHAIHSESIPVQSEQTVTFDNDDEQSNDVEIIEPEKEELPTGQD